MHSPWVSRPLSELGDEVIVAHAQSLGGEKKIGQQKDERTHETPTGLLMEGDSPQNHSQCQ